MGYPIWPIRSRPICWSADGENNEVRVLIAMGCTVVGSFGAHTAATPGNSTGFTPCGGRKGNVYTAMVDTGKRIQNSG